MVTNRGQITNNILGLGIGDSGDIEINATNLSVTNNGLIDSSTFGEGNGGDLRINTTDFSITDSAILSRVDPGAVGDAGDVNITTDSLALNNSLILSDTGSRGNAGTITVNANGTITLINNSRIASQVFPEAVGNAGDVTITTGSLIIDSSDIDNSTFGLGEPGGIFIVSEDSVLLDNIAFIANRAGQNAVGNSEGISITTDTLSLTNASQIITPTFGNVDAGDVNIIAFTEISFDGFNPVDPSVSSSIFTIANDPETEGNAGNINITTKFFSLNGGAALISGTNGIGDSGGDININATNVSLTNGADIRTNTTETSVADGGNITINASETIFLDGGSIFFEGEELSQNVRIATNNFGIGNAGDININTANLSINNGGQIQASTNGQGNAGKININASEMISINGQNNSEFETSIKSIIDTEGRGNSGEIEINTTNLSIANGGSIDADTFGQDNAGDIRINASELVLIDGQGSFRFDTSISSNVDIDGRGNVGDVEVTTNNLSLINGGFINSSIAGQGQGGSIKVNAADSVFIGDSSGIDSQVATPFAIGNAGTTEINTNKLFLSGRIDTRTLGVGNAGDITINVSESIDIDGGLISSVSDIATIDGSSDSIGNAGGITINTGSLTLTNEGQVDAGANGQGNAGSVIINATNNITIDGSSNISSRVNSEGVGDAGGVTITTDSLTLTNEGSVDASTSGQGNAGAVDITVSEKLTIDSSSNVSSRVNLEAVGNAGGISISTDSLSLTNGGQVDASTFGQGNAGSVNITATNNITIDGEQASGFPSGVSSRVNSGAVGDAGSITINTDSLSLTNGGRVATSTFGQGNAGSVEITATDTINIDGENSNAISSGVSSRVDQGAVGDAGGVTITTGSLTLTNGGRVGASTLSSGNAGNVTVNASESIVIDGVTENNRSGLSAAPLVSSGKGGNVNVFTDNLTIDNGGIIGAGNLDSLDRFDPGTGEPGSITVQANSLSLTNEGRISAATQSETGNAANINLQITEDITLRDNSFISARALEKADGGNLNINARFILGFPSQGSGNDLIATAEEGQGGNITINSRQIFNLQEGKAIDDNGDFFSNNRNDIDVSSQAQGLGGRITIFNPDTNTLATDTEVPTNLIESEQTYTQACQSTQTSDKPSGLTVKGKGGVPPEPTEPFDSEIILVDEEIKTSNIPANYPEIKPIKTSVGDIYPARGIIKTVDGKIILTSYPTDNINTTTPHISAHCTSS